MTARAALAVIAAALVFLGVHTVAVAAAMAVGLVLVLLLSAIAGSVIRNGYGITPQRRPRYA